MKDSTICSHHHIRAVLLGVRGASKQLAPRTNERKAPQP